MTAPAQETRQKESREVKTILEGDLLGKVDESLRILGGFYHFML
jgi:hypothetical protein